MKKIISVLSISMLVFAACKKNSSPSAIYTRLANMYDDSSRLTTTYYYTPANILSSAFDDSGRYSYSYHYLPNESIMQVSINGGSGYDVIYFWNGKSLVDSSITQNTSPGTAISKKYIYDNNNFLTNVKWYDYQNTLILNESFTITNGNITQHSYTAVGSSNLPLPSGSYSYTYLTGLVNTLGNNYLGQVYLGSSSKNPPASCTYASASGSSTVNYRYNYSGGNISSQLIYADSAGVNGARIDSLSFNYYN